MKWSGERHGGLFGWLLSGPSLRKNVPNERVGQRRLPKGLTWKQQKDLRRRRAANKRARRMRVMQRQR